MSETPEQLLFARRKRLMDAYELRKPDRIPIRLNFGYMLARLGGISNRELDNNPAVAQELLEKWTQYFAPDMASGLTSFVSAVSVMLGDRQTRWPGYGLPDDKPMQYVEDEYMKAEDYDAFLDDPTDFALRTFLPRTYENLEGLAKLPRLSVLVAGYPMFGALAMALANPALAASLQALARMAKFQSERILQMRKEAERMAALGFPSGIGYGMGAFGLAPFDFMSDTLRGMRGIFLDMHRRPEKLLAAEEKARRISAEAAIESCRQTGGKFVFIPLHRGSDGFMSLKQFEKFYWPQLKGLVNDLVDAGLVPALFYEGVWNERLHYLRELPKGKTAGHFQSTDISKLKETAGDVLSISGCFPVSLLQAGPEEKVREQTKRYCEILGRNGGFIMAANSSMDECDPRFVKVWVDATREYGGY
ncbi:MAG: hypothetical protein LAN36_04000 [Acidobacteriia bacterium]|nr:hypothetical protein [Terriglobia bacterium]